jgi:uncharacterized membrane protein YfhO
MATYIAFTLLLLIPLIFIIVILFNHLKKKFLSQEIDDNNTDENETYSETHRESNSTIQSPNDKATTATISTICDSPLNYELPPNY